MKKVVFLGGTCAETVWRDKLVKMLNMDYYNPVVEDWTEECMAEEIKQRQTCDYCLYVITPSMQGVYSIAEVVDDSNKRPKKTVFCVLSAEIPISENHYPHDKISFSIGEMKSLDQVGKMVKNNGGAYFKSLEDVAEYLNDKQKYDEQKILARTFIDGKPAPWTPFGYEARPEDFTRGKDRNKYNKEKEK